MSKPPDSSAERWSSRSVGSRRQHQGFYLLIRFPDASTLQRCWHRYRLLLAFGKVLIDRAAIGIIGPQVMRARLDGRRELLDLRDEQHGMIMMSAHVGCWQVAMATLEFLERPVHVVLRRDAGDIDPHYHDYRNGDVAYRIIDPAGYLGGTLEMMGALQRGEVVSIMGDRLLGSDRGGVTVDFLGGRIRVPFSAYKIAAATGAPIVVFTTSKEGARDYRLELVKVIRVPPLNGRREADFAPYAQQFATALDEYCRTNPYQYFNFFDLWLPHDAPEGETIDGCEGKTETGSD